MHGGGASKWDMKEELLSRPEEADTPSAKGRATNVSKAGKGRPIRDCQTRTLNCTHCDASEGASGGHHAYKQIHVYGQI